MKNAMQLTVKIDDKGRITLPKSIRKEININPGDIFYLNYDAEKKQMQLKKAVNPFNILAGEALKEYKKGNVKRIEKLAK
ncbi:MAG: AbrB/MazE/SpoVT family DNA-binding domain-containing protein [bacterium]